jgi:uncharacterized protein
MDGDCGASSGHRERPEGRFEEMPVGQLKAGNSACRVGSRVAIGLIGLGLLATLVAACGSPTLGSTTVGAKATAPTTAATQGIAVGAANTITVFGSATVDTSPDEAVVTISVETQGTNPASALDANSKTTKNVADRLSSEGVATDAVQTSNVTVYADRTYDPRTGKESITGYRASNTVLVKLKDAATVGKVLGAAVEAGATNVSGPVWRVAADSASIMDALKKAVANAQAKAQALADAQGVKLGAVLTMTEGSTDQPLTPQYDSVKSAAGSAVATPPVSAGTVEITANMTVTYSLAH